MHRKLIVSLLILLLICGSIFFLWRYAVVLSAVLLLAAYLKHRLYPIKFELLWFGSICIGGAITEGLLVNFAGAWSYDSSQLFDIPVWMPLFWGVVGTTLIVLYDGLTESITKPKGQ
jgi:hypothetical protein